MLVILAWWANDRHVVKQRHRAHAMLEALATSFGVGAILSHQLDPIFADARDACEERLDGQDFCPHLINVVQLQSEGHNPALRLAKCLVQLSCLASACPACRDCMQCVVAAWNDHMQDVLDDDDKFAMNLGKMNHMKFGAKRLRTDGDYKAFCVEEMVRGGRAHSGTQVLRVHGDISSDQAIRWESQRLKAYMACGWRVMGGPGVYVITEDGARIGQPAEETVVYSAHESTDGFEYVPSSSGIGSAKSLHHPPKALVIGHMLFDSGPQVRANMILQWSNRHCMSMAGSV